MTTGDGLGGWPERPAPADPEALRAVRAAAARAVPADADQLDVDVAPVSGVPVLLGTLPTWADVVRAGHAAAGEWRLRGRRPSAEVVVDCTVSGMPHAPPPAGLSGPPGSHGPPGSSEPPGSSGWPGPHEPPAGPGPHEPPAGPESPGSASLPGAAWPPTPPWPPDATRPAEGVAGRWHGAAGEPGPAPGERGPTSASRPSPLSGTLPEAADAVVVGAGICGLVTARALARRGLRVAVFEAGPRIAGETTAWNNGMVHPGHDPLPGTHKAVLNVAGNAAWTALAAALGTRLDRRGSLVVALDESDLAGLEELAARARANRVPGAELISGDRAREREPRLGPQVRAALWTPSAAVVDPVRACRAIAADLRGRDAVIVLGAAVRRLLTERGRVVGVRVGRRDVLAPLVVNAAGIQADRLAATCGARRYSLHARRGTLVLYDPGPADRHDLSVGPVPGGFTKGGGMTARPDGLTTGGPTAVEQWSRIPQPPTQTEVDAITTLGRRMLPRFPFDSALHIGSQVRAATYGEDFVVGAAPGVPGLVDVAGTQSPGLASAPAIATAVVAELDGLGWLPARRDGPASAAPPPDP